MTEATAVPAVDYDSPEMSKKRRSTVGWVVTLAFLGLVFDGYDLVVYGAVLPRFLLGEPGNAVLGTPLTAAQAGGGRFVRDDRG